MAETLGINLLSVVAVVTLLWGCSVVIRNASIIDLFWGLGFVLISWISFSRLEPIRSADWLLPVLVTIWGLRLSGYLAIRNLGHGEDKRYAKMREQAGPSFWWKSYFIVFLLQAAIMWLVSLPLQLASGASDWSALHVAGIVLWLIGLLFETVGDLQLMMFKANPENAGKVLDRGLWKYTRHPNYFGDCLVWWGIFTIAWANQAPLATVLCPILMTFLLLQISGVKLLESELKSSKPEYQDYMERTNAFLPGIPRRKQ